MSDMQKEATMEDILASIRQIISDEDDSIEAAPAAANSPNQGAEPEPFFSHDEAPKAEDSAAERMDIGAVLAEFATAEAEETVAISQPSQADRPEAPVESQPSQDAVLPPETVAEADMEIVDFTADHPTPDAMPMNENSAPSNMEAPIGQTPPSSGPVSDNPLSQGGAASQFIVLDDMQADLSAPDNPSIFPENSDEVSMEFSGTSKEPQTLQLEGSDNLQMSHNKGEYVDFFSKKPDPTPPKLTDIAEVELGNNTDDFGVDDEPSFIDSVADTHSDLDWDTPPDSSHAANTQNMDSVGHGPTPSASGHPEFGALTNPQVSKAAATTIGSLFAELEMSGDKTIEALIREILRPLLKEWLDNNLAKIVDEKVEEEIRRIARLAR